MNIDTGTVRNVIITTATVVHLIGTTMAAPLTGVDNSGDMPQTGSTGRQLLGSTDSILKVCPEIPWYLTYNPFAWAVGTMVATSNCVQRIYAKNE